ncbi:hypothetical protein PGT21_002063 [Puccinia graminis f. sp. tritici]|uniref:Uncharacterized protein n=1 Tax=Puccinia graminis f. sp. tritici TaxID=56615 RepID=A0A5B0LY82_PUCGR|nr:hypothetical protein PGT21_002063 [Puccinia graminis f. sp. tritici]
MDDQAKLISSQSETFEEQGKRFSQTSHWTLSSPNSLRKYKDAIIQVTEPLNEKKASAANQSKNGQTEYNSRTQFIAGRNSAPVISGLTESPPVAKSKEHGVAGIKLENHTKLKDQPKVPPDQTLNSRKKFGHTQAKKELLSDGFVKSEVSQIPPQSNESQLSATMKPLTRNKLNFRETGNVDMKKGNDELTNGPKNGSKRNGIDQSIKKADHTSLKAKPEKQTLKDTSLAKYGSTIASANQVTSPLDQKPINFETNISKGNHSVKKDEKATAIKLLSSSERSIQDRRYVQPSKTNKQIMGTKPAVSNEKKNTEINPKRSKDERKSEVLHPSWGNKNRDAQSDESSSVSKLSQELAEINNQRDTSSTILNGFSSNPDIHESPFQSKKLNGIQQRKSNKTHQERQTGRLTTESDSVYVNGGTEKIDEKNNEYSKDNQSKESTDIPISASNSAKPISEEKNILDLIENRRYPKIVKEKSNFEARFMVDYESQAEILNSAYQKAKERYKSENSNKSSASIMSSLKIEPDINKKMRDKINLSCEKVNIQPWKNKNKRQRLKDYPESTIKTFFEMWGKPTVSSWENSGFDMGFMLKLALILNLDHKKSHFGISPTYEDKEFYVDFMHMRLDQKKLSIVVDSVYKILGKEEGTRRLEAFCYYLKQNTISAYWSFLKQKKKFDWFRETYYGLNFGLSEEPGLVLEFPAPASWSKALRRFDTKMDYTQEDLAIIYGDQEGLKKLELVNYIDNCPYDDTWWRSIDLESAVVHFGLDPLIILKIGNSLQFGSRDLLDNDKHRIPLEEAFLTILNIITKPRTLPWIESAERAWIYSVFGSLYPDRLRELGYIILSKNVFLENQTKQASGSDLIWSDLGLEIRESPSELIPENAKEAMQKYEKISGPFSEYSKIAISIWIRYFCGNPPYASQEVKQEKDKNNFSSRLNFKS